MPKFYMMIGLPGSGKSTWIENNKKNAIVVSTDNEIEAIAASKGLTYDQVFPGAIKGAEGLMKEKLASAIRNSQDIIWDQTNLTRRSRAKKLSLIPANYYMVGVYFDVPLNIIEHRLTQRPGKTIPPNILQSMIKMFEPPSKSEGFDRIMTIYAKGSL